MRQREQYLVQWRGHLPFDEPGARGIEHWARNPDCLRLAALTLCGISPATALTKIYKKILDGGISPLAIQAGKLFERQLFAHQAEKIRALYTQAGRLSHPVSVLNLEDVYPRHMPNAMTRRRLLTTHLLQRKIQGDRGLPHLILHARLQLVVLGITHDIEPDFLVGSDNDTCYRPSEIKSFSDRGAKTDTADLRGALRQAAVSIVCLHQQLQRLGHQAVETFVPPLTDLILRKPGSVQATLHTMAVEQECVSIDTIVQQAQQSFDHILTQLATSSSTPCLEQATLLDSLQNNYHAQCKEFCALACQCKEQARHSSNLLLLGASVQEKLYPAQTIQRALDYLYCEHLEPDAEEETLLMQRLRDAGFLLDKALEQ